MATEKHIIVRSELPEWYVNFLIHGGVGLYLPVTDPTQSFEAAKRTAFAPVPLESPKDSEIPPC